MISKAFPGLGIDLCLGVVMKIELKVSGFKLNDYLFSGTEVANVTALNKRLDEMEEI